MENEPVVAPYGSWPSPVGSSMLATGRIGLSDPRFGDVLHWLEFRPQEDGRYVVVRQDGDESKDVTPPGFNVRTMVHEYGGAPWLLAGATVWFSNFADQRIYRQEPGTAPVPISPEPPSARALRYADGRLTADGAWILCVRERHENGLVTNELAAVPADGTGQLKVLASGRDFYSSPRLSPDGRRLAWLEWDHPRMPWDGTELWLADLGADLDVKDRRLVAGEGTESIVQPEWSPEGVLHFVSDRSGWWNLYRSEDGGTRPLAPREEEFGLPAWEFGYSTYCFMEDGRIACVHGLAEASHLGLLDPEKGAVDDLDLPFTYFGSHLATDGRGLAFVGGAPTEPVGLIQLDPADGSYRVLRSSHRERLDPGYVSVPQPIEFPTEGGRTAHALFFPPANKDVRGPDDELPPLVTMSHGGPTAHTPVRFGLDVQFWTSRGFAVVDVNYGGSTGYGRDYRERLRGQWGVVDVTDCVNAAKYLAAERVVDGGRMAIRGGSAGGYVALCAITFHDAFTAAASYFGIGDLETFVKDTHKFESRYCDGLVGPYPEAIEVYRQRSPIHFLDRVSCPVILLQGMEDAIVPPSQAEQMVAALDAQGLPYAYVAFPAEQHGFRKAETIQRSIEAELYFYSRLWGFEPADRIEPVPIRNLPEADGTA